MDHSNFARTVFCLIAIGSAALLAGCDDEGSASTPTVSLSQAALTVAGRSVQNYGNSGDVTVAATTAPSDQAASSPAQGTPSVGSGASNPGGTSSATLSWNPPTENTDGTRLTDLIGYRIVYGTTPGHLSNVVTVSNPGLAAYVIENLSAGATYYFAVAAVASDGVASAYSPEVSTTIS